MKISTSILTMASLSLLLALRLPSFAGAAAAAPEEERTSKGQIEREQRKFLVYIQDGENEYKNAIDRKARNISLWQNNVANAQIRLDITFTLMDGNDKFKGHQSRIPELKKFFSEGKWVGILTSNYLAIRDRAYVLQNKLNPLLEQLDPATRAWLEAQRAKIRSSGTASGTETTGAEALSGVAAAEQRSAPVSGPGGGAGHRQDLGGGYSYDPSTGMVYGPDGKPIPGAKVGPDGRITFPSGYSINPKTGQVYGPDGNPINGATLGPDGIHLPDGSVINPATGARMTGGPGTPGTSANSNPNIPASEEEVDIGDWSDWNTDPATGRATRTKVRAFYPMGRANGTLGRETVITQQKGADGAVGNASQQSFEWELILKSDPQDGKEVFHVENKARVPREFTIDSWDVLLNGASVASSRDQTCVVTYTQPGNYQIVASGKTKPFNIPFKVSDTRNKLQ